MEITSPTFKQNATAALADVAAAEGARQCARAASSTSARKAVERAAGIRPLRDKARDIKDHTLAHLDFYLEAYEAKVIASGGQVHWAETPTRRAASCSTSAARPARHASPRASR